MKIASKVLIIISICLAGLIVFVGFIASIGSCTYSVGLGMAMFFLYAILCTPAIVVGGIALKKLESAKKKEDLTAISIITLIFCNLVAGILMLCMDNQRDFAIAPIHNPTISDEISSIKKDMEDLGISSIEEYKNYLKIAEERKKQEENEYKDVIILRNDLKK